MKIAHTRLNDPPDAAVWAVVGEEDLARRQAIAVICARFLDESFSEFDCDRMEGDALDASRALSAWQTLPMASPRRVVLVSRADEAPASEIRKLADSVTMPCGRGCLVLDVRSDSGKDMQALLKAVESAGVLVTCAAAKAEDARGFLSQAAQRAGVKIESPAAEELIRRLGSDLWQLESETQKLANYVHPADVIRRGDVDKLIPAAPEDRVFAMIDAVCEARLPDALRMLDDLFLAADDERGAAHRTLALLARHFRLLWQARALREAGFGFRDAGSIPAPAEECLLKNPNLRDVLKRQAFLMRKFSAQSSRFGYRRLSAVFDVLAECDLALKGYAASAGAPRPDLQMCLTKIGLLARTGKQPGSA